MEEQDTRLQIHRVFSECHLGERTEQAATKGLVRAQSHCVNNEATNGTVTESAAASELSSCEAAAAEKRASTGRFEICANQTPESVKNSGALKRKKNPKFRTLWSAEEVSRLTGPPVASPLTPLANC